MNTYVDAHKAETDRKLAEILKWFPISTFQKWIPFTEAAKYHAFHKSVLVYWAYMALLSVHWVLHNESSRLTIWSLICRNCKHNKP